MLTPKRPKRPRVTVFLDQLDDGTVVAEYAELPIVIGYGVTADEAMTELRTAFLELWGSLNSPDSELTAYAKGIHSRMRPLAKKIAGV